MIRQLSTGFIVLSLWIGIDSAMAQNGCINCQLYSNLKIIKNIPDVPWGLSWEEINQKCIENFPSICSVKYVIINHKKVPQYTCSAGWDNEDTGACPNQRSSKKCGSR